MILPSVGCNSLGPSAIFNGREAYNEAIRTTDEQQILKLIVELRYGRLAGPHPYSRSPFLGSAVDLAGFHPQGLILLPGPRT